MIRTLLVLGCVLLIVAVVAAMGWGWRRRGQRQEPVLPPLPAAPAEPGQLLLGPLTGVYVGTTFATSWQDRVVAGGLGRRAAATVALHETGVVVDRQGEPPVFLPRAALIHARLAAGLAGTVVGAGGLLVLRWSAGDQQLDTGFRADDKRAYPEWIQRVSAASTEEVQ